jgi:ABC-type nitrate/sulfonate/bicarbonate transport system substrate-binding protein
MGIAQKDVSLLVVGGTTERIASLRAGKIQATLFSPPQNFAAQAEGFNLLADVADLGLPFVHVGVATTRGFVRDNPETVRRYVKSHLEAIHLMKTDRETGIKVLAKYLRSVKDREILSKTYDGAIPDNKFTRKQYPSMPGLQMALELLAEENPKAKSAKADDFVDARFIKELDQSGYIDGLYKAKEK